MKRKITLLLVAASAALTMNSQVLLQEEFTSPFVQNINTTGWITQNNSDPVGTTSWFQGNASAFAAYSGGGSNYIAVNYQSGDVSGSTISNWLISPTVTIQNGFVFQFATRTASTQSNSNAFPDGLQLRMSTTDNTVIAVTSSDVGTYTTVLLDINPNLTHSVVSAVNNGSVNGYPNVWTVYTVAITGVPTPVTGRFAFRYYVTNAGSASTNNANYIGIDAVKYVGACVTPVANSYTTCSNTPIILSNTVTGLSSTGFLWSNSSGTVATGTAYSYTTASGTEVYTIQTTNNNVLCAPSYSASTTVTVTIDSYLSINLTASSPTVCSQNTATLTAIAPATSYTWISPGGSSNVTAVNQSAITPSVVGTNVYTVQATSAACTGSAFIAIITNSLPVITTSAVNTACPGRSYTLAVSGGSNYLWDIEIYSQLFSSTGNFVATLPATVNTVISPDTYEYDVYGLGSNGCVGVGTNTFIVASSPTLDIVSASGHTYDCHQDPNAELIASGADSYTWNASTQANNPTIPALTAAQKTMNPLSYTTTTGAGLGTGQTSVNRTFTLTGKSDETGCTSTMTLSMRIYKCTGIENINGGEEASVYPNPFTNELKIDAFTGHVNIYNTLGQLVISTSVKEKESISTAELPKGVYVLKAYNQQGAEVRAVKLIKN